ncbi:hypothetical protein SAMN05216490_3328 [Mucilaginibacter mallensis]|uniref:Uncharacterized protein n=1 Tax=Mucilaginibacter mallensis TaxID=652787 RepID=A0A1H2A0A7_MUCMA|nr:MULTISPECIES: hypothetical protein [Mucilaginibacter]MBB6141568.1 hypothetical protein [Mucilaginibacter sp. X5P1]SDT39471.1 hypothetical protein SAMN05216490_3328 [Mucilaginibacter mallensis]
MTNSILEITENEYLIKLNRQNFNLSFIRSLLKMVEVANPADDHNNMMMSDRRIITSQSNSSEPEYYSSIDEK